MRTKIILITGAITLLPLTALAAATTAPTTKEQAQQAKLQANCDAQNARITTRITNANAAIAKRQQLDQDAQTHWQNLMNRAEAAPYSIAASDATITALQADVADFQGQLTTNIADHQTYVNDLQVVLGTTCGQRQSVRTQAQADFKTWQAEWGRPYAIRVQQVRQDVLALLQKMKSAKKGTSK